MNDIKVNVEKTELANNKGRLLHYSNRPKAYEQGDTGLKNRVKVNNLKQIFTVVSQF